jgi:hypothetical protein
MMAALLDAAPSGRDAGLVTVGAVGGKEEVTADAGARP